MNVEDTIWTEQNATL